MEVLAKKMENLTVRCYQDSRNMPPISSSLLAMMENTLRFEYLAGAVTQLHGAHCTGMRILPYSVCSSLTGGAHRMFFDDTGECDMRDGEGFIAPAGVRHRSTLNSPASVCRWAHFRVTIFDAVDAFRFLVVPHIVKKKTADKLGELCEALSALPAPPDEAWPFTRIAQRKTFGFQLFSLIADNSKPHPAASVLLDSMHRLLPLLQRMQVETATPMSLAAMAKAVGLSPSRFCALFRQCLGVPPGEYQRLLRLNAAKVLLLDSEKSIQQIADELGFDDPFHFSKTFKKSSGMNPRQYRALLRKGMWRQ